MKNVLYIVDDHPVVRNGLKAWLEANTEWKIPYEYSTANECIYALSSLNENSELFPEIIIVDVQLVGENGFSLVKNLTAKFPQIKSIMYSMFDTAGFVLQAQDCGAKGYISKIATETEMAHALEIVQNGGFYLEQKMHETQEEIKSILPFLTKQEKIIFEAMLQGKSNEEISNELFVSKHTMENYIHRLYDKIDVKNRKELLEKFK